MEGFLVDLIYVWLFGTVFICVPFAVGEWLFNWAYAHIPAFTQWWDKYCQEHPDWEDEEEVL